MLISRTVWLTATLALLLLAMLWPAFYNGQPIVFADTAVYVRGADAGVQAIFHRKSLWSLPQESLSGPSAANAVSAPRSLNSIKDKTVMTGRSVYYGALLYLGDVTGGFWLTVVLQAGAVLATMLLAVRSAGHKLWPVLPALGAFLVLFTTAPFFAGFLMPDLFAGVAIVVGATVLARDSNTGWGGYLGSFALLVISAVVHDSHVLILASMLAVAAIGNLAARSWKNWRGLSVLGATVVTALLAQTLFAVVVTHVVGAPPIRPPFLMARLIDDGAGYSYLRATCPGSGFKVCEYLGRLPLASDEFLWNPDSERGVFAAADPESRRQLSNEQMRFALAVLAHDPAGALLIAAKNAVAQLLLVGLDEFNIDDAEKRAFKLPKEYLQSVQRSAAYREAMPVAQCTVIVLAVLVAAVALIVWAVISPGARKRLPAPLAKMSLWTVTGVLANAAVCGAISGPHMRYSARVDWVVPMIAVLIAIVEIERWRLDSFLAAGPRKKLASQHAAAEQVAGASNGPRS